MKSLIKILPALFITILLYSCAEDTVSPSESTSLINISGKIEDWAFGDSLILKAELLEPFVYNDYVLDSCTIHSDGSFSINLKIPPDSMLSVFNINWDTACRGNVVVNPPDIKTSSFISLEIYSVFSDSFSIGSVSRRNPRDTSNWTKPGDFGVYYLYSNNNGSVTGTEICNDVWFFPDTTIFNINGIKGWNKIVYNYLSYSSSSVKMLVNTTEPAGGKWYAQMNFDSKLRDSKKSFKFINKCLSCQ
jgi:hypothetical protein